MDYTLLYASSLFALLSEEEQDNIITLMLSSLSQQECGAVQTG